MTKENDFITLEEVASLLGEKKMDKRTVKVWLNDNKVRIEKIGGQLKVSLMCFRLAKERLLVDSLKHQYDENWTTIYDLVAEDEKLKKVMLQIDNKEVVQNATYESEYFNV